MKTTQRTG